MGRRRPLQPPRAPERSLASDAIPKAMPDLALTVRCSFSSNLQRPILGYT